MTPTFRGTIMKYETGRKRFQISLLVYVAQHKKKGIFYPMLITTEANTKKGTCWFKNSEKFLLFGVLSFPLKMV